MAGTLEQDQTAMGQAGGTFLQQNRWKERVPGCPHQQGRCLDLAEPVGQIEPGYGPARSLQIPSNL